MRKVREPGQLRSGPQAKVESDSKTGKANRGQEQPTATETALEIARQIGTGVALGPLKYAQQFPDAQAAGPEEE